jgi:hypothetical protein
MKEILFLLFHILFLQFTLQKFIAKRRPDKKICIMLQFLNTKIFNHYLTMSFKTHSIQRDFCFVSNDRKKNPASYVFRFENASTSRDSF